MRFPAKGHIKRSSIWMELWPISAMKVHKRQTLASFFRKWRKTLFATINTTKACCKISVWNLVSWNLKYHFHADAHHALMQLCPTRGHSWVGETLLFAFLIFILVVPLAINLRMKSHLLCGVVKAGTRLLPLQLGFKHFHSAALMILPVLSDWCTRNLLILCEGYLASQQFFDHCMKQLLNRKRCVIRQRDASAGPSHLPKYISLQLPYLGSISNNIREKLSTFIRHKAVINVKLRCFQNTRKLESWLAV